MGRNRLRALKSAFSLAGLGSGSPRAFIVESRLGPGIGGVHQRGAGPLRSSTTPPGLAYEGTRWASSAVAVGARNLGQRLPSPEPKTSIPPRWTFPSLGGLQARKPTWGFGPETDQRVAATHHGPPTPFAGGVLGVGRSPHRSINQGSGFFGTSAGKRGGVPDGLTVNGRVSLNRVALFWERRRP